MSRQQKKVPSDLKHGGYSAATILPGESRSEFDTLHRDLISELRPDGPLEHDVVSDISQIVWRKQHLSTFRKAELANRRLRHLEEMYRPDKGFEAALEGFGIKSSDRKAARQAAENHARKELGKAYELIEVGETATLDRLTQELEVQDRLQAMIDRQLKRLLLLKGLKSWPAAPCSPQNILPAPIQAASPNCPSPSGPATTAMIETERSS